MGRRFAGSVLIVVVGCTGAFVSSPVSAGVPDGWGDPTYESAGIAISARQGGRIPGRPGNQHVVHFSVPATGASGDSGRLGEITDWRCPPGVTAPVWADSETACSEKARYWIQVDESAGGAVAHAWSRRLTWMVFRAPIEVVDYPYDEVESSAAVGSGTASLRVRSSGALSVSVYDEPDGRSTYTTRADAFVVGGRVLGTPWLDLDSITVTTDVYVYREYALD